TTCLKVCTHFLCVQTSCKVKIRPSAEVTEGQKVTLTCSTSCPLTQNSNFRWYLNYQPLKLENKHLVIDAVTSQDAGNYSCVDKTKENSKSPVKTLTVTSTSPKTPTVTSAGPKTLTSPSSPLLYFTGFTVFSTSPVTTIMLPRHKRKVRCSPVRPSHHRCSLLIL
uniref:Ig-like domain-containing protein n=1 Tax=Oryzias latipes TaxID=8090 RepID=A0A3P9HHR8_ORYLA